jgi:biopolymer transport protein TolQ
MNAEAARSSLSMYSMFAESDLFMKLLILGLLFASFWCWAIIYDKIKLLRRVRMGMKAFEEKFWSGGSLETLYNAYVKNPVDPLSAIFVAAMTELKRSLTDKKKAAGSINLDERIEKVMQITIDKHADKMETKMVFLASTGSVAPLLGLFGTVWGIMDSFNAIGATQSTNIAAVAPGDAEALFTTAVGLIAAIPALIAHNKLSNDIDRIVKKMETFSDELGAIVSRQVEQMEK